MGRSIVVLALALSAASAFAQPLQEPAPGTTPAQVQQLFDAMIVMQAQEVLGLGEQQYGQFLTRLRVLQDVRRRHQQQRQRLIAELQRLTNPRAAARVDADDAEIKDRLSALQELESRTAAETRRAYEGIDEILDMRQRARFRVFEEQMERRKLELIGRARQNAPKRQEPVARPNPRRPPGR